MNIKNILYILLIAIQTINAADYAEKLKRLEIAEANLKIAQEKEKVAEENYRKIVEKHQTEMLQREEEEAKQRALERQNRIARQLTHQTFFAPLREYQSKQLQTVLSTISDTSITTLYRNAGWPATVNVPQEMLETHKEKLLEVLPEYNLTIDDWLKSEWPNALKELTSQPLSSEKKRHSIDLEQVPQLIQDAKNIFRAFLPPQGIICLTEENFITKRAFTERRLITYLKIKKVIEEKKLSHVHLPVKLLIIKQNYQRITDQQVASSLLDRYITLNLDYLGQGNAALGCWGPLFLDPENTCDIVILAEKITDTGKRLNDEVYNELKQLVQDAPFDIGYANIFTDDKGDAIIIDTEFKGEPAKSCIAKLNRYR